MTSQPDSSTTSLLSTVSPLAGSVVAPPTITIRAASAGKTEGTKAGTTAFTFTISRTASSTASAVNWSIVHGGTDASDFSGATGGLITFNSGETSKTLTINVAADALAEMNELFSVQLSGPTNAVIGGTGLASSTILNDDKPRLSIAASNAAVQEGTATADGTTPVLFTVTRDTGIGVSSVKWAIVHRGTNAADFIGPTAGTVDFADGETSRKITVWLVADAVVEPDEAFSVQLSSPTNATLTSATASALMKVVNDDLPSLSIAAAPTSVSRNEGNTGTTPFTFTVTRSSGVGTSTVSWKVFDVTTDAADFSGTTSGVLTFSNGQTSKTITVNVVGDKVGEANELFGVELSAPGNATLATSFAKVTIVNDDTVVAPPTLSIAATEATRNEGNSGTTPFTFTVTRSSGTGASSASWAVQHGTTSADDFSGATSGIVSFATGETSKVITVNVVGDLAVEQDEAFSVLLSSPSGATLGTASASGSILTDDLPVANISATSADKAEGSSGTTPFTFTITRSSGFGASWVNWAVTHGTTSAADFSGPTSGTVTFAAGETSKTVTLDVVGDAVTETDEAFRVDLIDSNNGAAFVTIGTGSASGTIRDDDTVIVPSLSIAATSAAKAEGNSGTTPFTFTVTRSSGTGTSTADYTVVHGSTTAADFSAPTSGTVSFASGETSKVITINVAGDTVIEGDEAFSVQLSNATGATIGTATASGTIQNDDTATLPTFSIAVNPASQAEGNSGTTPFTFTVTRSSGTGTSTVNWLLASGGADSADFAAGTPIGVNTTLSFAAGETSKTIAVNVLGDTAKENDETFSVQLSSPTGATLGASSTASATILDDDTPVISIAPANADQTEGDSGTKLFTFTVTRNTTVGVSQVSYRTLSGTATAGTDTYIHTGTLAFNNGQNSATVSIMVIGDTHYEPDETFSVELHTPVNARLGTALATGTIRNDDPIGRTGIDKSIVTTTNLTPPGQQSLGLSQAIENLIGWNIDHDNVPSTPDIQYTPKWGGATGTGVTLTYSFSTANSVFSNPSSTEAHHTALNDTQKSAARWAMNAVSAMCNVTFVEVADTATSTGDIRWTRLTDPEQGSVSYAGLPSVNASGGDIWIGPSPLLDNPTPGSGAYDVFLHELAHALGLVHPHEGIPAPLAGQDQIKYSVMSYRAYDGAPTEGATGGYLPTTYMLNDMLALQYLYGANTTTRPDNTVYQWASNTPVYECLWDTGGIDAIDASNQAQTCTVDLREGQWSTIGPGFDVDIYTAGTQLARNTLTIAYGAVIENAVGSAQADTLIGNTVANRLTGGAGADTLTGGTGADVFFFATPTDGGDTITDFVSGTDTIELTSANFAGLPVGALAASRFVSGSAPVATDGSAVFLYSTASGQLVFDTNGNAAGGTTLIATLGNHAPVVSNDLRIVAAPA